MLRHRLKLHHRDWQPSHMLANAAETLEHALDRKAHLVATRATSHSEALPTGLGVATPTKGQTPASSFVWGRESRSALARSQVGSIGSGTRNAAHTTTRGGAALATSPSGPTARPEPMASAAKA